MQEIISVIDFSYLLQSKKIWNRKSIFAHLCAQSLKQIEIPSRINQSYKSEIHFFSLVFPKSQLYTINLESNSNLILRTPKINTKKKKSCKIYIFFFCVFCSRLNITYANAFFTQNIFFGDWTIGNILFFIKIKILLK